MIKARLVEISPDSAHSTRWTPASASVVIKAKDLTWQIGEVFEVICQDAWENGFSGWHIKKDGNEFYVLAKMEVLEDENQNY